MFGAKIFNTPLTTSAADSLFRNINGNTIVDDISFLATLRALVYPRMKDEDLLTLSYSEIYHDAGVAITPSCSKGLIDIHNFLIGETNDTSFQSLIEKKVYMDDPMWIRLDKITDFFRKTFRVICFVNPELKSVALYTNNMNRREMHYLQCSIPAFLPWYFDPKTGISKLEMELINSLREKNADKYKECIAEIASQYDFRAQSIRCLLSGFETKFERLECVKVRENITAITEEICNLNRSIGNRLREKAEQEIKLLGLETKIQNETSEDSEIMEYFLCNNKLVLEDVTDSIMSFSCMDYLTYFDEDMAEQMINNVRSYVYLPHGRPCNNYIEATDMKKLMWAVFIDRTLRIKFCAAYCFSLYGDVRALGRHAYGFEFRECMPNPHIDAYACMGNYQPQINQLLSDHNYIGAIEQCVASCKSLNFADSTVMSEFMCRLYGIETSSSHAPKYKCIELPDGSVVTPKEAIQWLNSSENDEQKGEIVNE